MSPRDWPKLQEWVALVEKQVGEDAGWHHPGGDLVAPRKTTICFREADPEGAFQAE